MIGIDENMPVGAMNIGELRTFLTEILESASQGAIRKPGGAAPKRYVYGIKGIEELFGCSHATAQHYKDTVIADAVTQNGRKIIVDADYAVELFGRRKDNAGK